jgi:hypothetical protein
MANFWDIGTNVGLNPSSVAGQLANGLPGIIENNVVNPLQRAFQGPGQFNTPQMSQQSASQITQAGNGLLATPAAATAKMLNNSDTSGTQDTSTGAALGQAESGGYGAPGMSKAIQDKAAKSFAVDQGKVSQQAQIMGMQQSNANVLQATNNALTLQAAELGVANKVTDFQMASAQAQYSVISGLMQGAGKIGGAIIGANASPNSNLEGALQGAELGFTPPGSGGTPNDYFFNSTPGQDLNGMAGNYNFYEQPTGSGYHLGGG